MATRKNFPRIAVVAALAASVAIVAIGWSATASSKAAARHATSAATVQTKTLKKLGTVLVNSKGRTLYMFVPDKRKKVTCVKSCTVIWPPVKLPKGAKPVAAGKAKPSLLGSDPNPAGGRVVTYNGWPLYTYTADKKSGDAVGNDIKSFGASWYALLPTGENASG